MILVLGAFGPELAPLDGRLPKDVVAAAAGIGLVESALGAAEAIRRHSPRAVVFVGTAGAMPGSTLGPLDVACLSSTVLAEPSTSGELPEPMRSEVVADAALREALFGDLRAVRVATTLGITTDDRAARALEQATQAELEHLEAFAVGRAAARANIRYCALFGVSNRVGSSGRGEWRTNHREASARAADTLVRALDRGLFRPLLQEATPTTL
jgi:nucleoside phosphorylase